uniref:protein phosphatase methylesterase-1 n=1 Tax=Romanomermis culicivorax TaxID=13658 RepID=A0A915JSZ8_ROMCU
MTTKSRFLSVKSGQVRNLESARISMPGQIRNCFCLLCSKRSLLCFIHRILSNRQKSDQADDVAETSQISARKKYEWRIDLSRTESYWRDWFRNLSAKFLSCKQAKLLILAGVDRLDKELTIGQMQGKFQMIVLPKVGHCVQEDSPERLAEAVSSFLVRNLICKATKNFKPVFPGC